MEQIRLVKEMRENERRNGRTGINIRPRWMVWENVVGAFSSNKGADFQAVLTEIVRIAEPDAPDVPMPEKGKWGKAGELHDEMGRWSVAWRTHDAQYWGVPQRRKRISVVADFSGGGAAKVLFDEYIGAEPESEVQPVTESLSRNFGQGEEKRKETAGDVSDGFDGAIGGAISFQERAGKPGGGKGILIQNERTGALSTLNNQSVFGIPAYNSNVMKSANPNSGYVEEDSARTLDSNYQGGTAIVYRKQGHPQNAEQPQKCEQTETADTLNVSDNSDARTPILIKQEVFSDTAAARCAQDGRGAVHSQMMADPERNFVLQEVFENHTQDSRYKPLGEVCSTLATNLGTGGNNQPLVVNSSGGDVSGTLDASYYKGCGERQNVEREVVCVGNGQMCNISMKPIANTLDTMHDAQAILSYGVDCYNQEEEVTTTIRAKADNEHIPCTYSLDRAYFNQGKNAQYNPSVSVETTQTIVSKGPNAVCARDSKGVGNQYVDEGKCVVGSLCARDSKGVGIVRRLTPIECEKLQGFPQEKKWNVEEMTKDEYIAFNLAERNIIADPKTGKVYGTRGPGGIPYNEPKELKGTELSGYKVVSIRNGGTKLQCRVHRIIWISQHGIIPDGYCIDHINNNKLDNRIENLQLLTPAENTKKAAEDGLFKTGLDNKATKLDPDLKDEIAYLYHYTDFTQRQLADVYGISKSRINQIIKEIGWTDIGEWVDSKGKKHKEADSPRYKALGNSIALPFWFWLLRRISATYSRRATLGSLFDGIGGFPYVWEMCNGKGTARWASEIEEFAIAVTKKHFPESEET